MTMKARVTVHTKATGGAVINTAAQFIPVEMLVRLGRYEGTKGDRKAIWRLEHRDQKRAYDHARRTVSARIDNDMTLA